MREYKYDRVAIAVALLDGTISWGDQRHVDELMCPAVLWAAEIIWREKREVERASEMLESPRDTYDRGVYDTLTALAVTHEREAVVHRSKHRVGSKPGDGAIAVMHSLYAAWLHGQAIEIRVRRLEEGIGDEK